MPNLNLPRAPNAMSPAYNGANGMTQYRKDIATWINTANNALQVYASQAGSSVGNPISVSAVTDIPALTQQSSTTDVATVLCYVVSLLQEKGILAANNQG